MRFFVRHFEELFDRIESNLHIGDLKTSGNHDLRVQSTAKSIQATRPKRNGPAAMGKSTSQAPKHSGPGNQPIWLAASLDLERALIKRRQQETGCSVCAGELEKADIDQTIGNVRGLLQTHSPNRGQRIGRLLASLIFKQEHVVA